MSDSIASDIVCAIGWVLLVSMLLLLGQSCVHPVIERTVIPAIPYLNRQVLLMDVLDDDIDVCTFSHAYTGRTIRHCASLGAVRAFINGHLLADDH